MILNLPLAPRPENAAALADICVESARKVSGVELDYGPASLTFVDDQVGRFAEGGVQLDEIASTLFCFGCYVGEVLARVVGGRWIAEEESPMRGLAGWPMVLLLPNGGCWNPIGKVFKRFEEGPGENIPYFFSTVAEHSRRGAK